MGLESVLNKMDTEQEFDTEIENSNKKTSTEPTEPPKQNQN